MGDIIRVGYIAAIDYENGTAQVVYKDRDNAVSPYLPLFSNEFDPPPVETMVYVIHLENGGTRGVILPPPYTDGNRPQEGKKEIWRKDFGDGNYIKYNKLSKHLEIVSDLVSVKKLSVSGNITVDGIMKAKSINAESISTTGNVHVGGDLTVSGTYPT